jgi:mRNA deadenylase 3'-5' endonuclease subunit Ccr4
MKATPCYGPDGCVVFFKKSVFQINNLRCQNISIGDEQCPQVSSRLFKHRVALLINNNSIFKVFIILQLKHIASGKLVTVVCLHLKGDPPYSQKRAEQLEFILSALKHHLANVDDLSRHPVLVCGDFNGEQTERFFNLITNDPKLRFKNSHHDFTYGKQLPTFRIREQDQVIACAIDFIFYTDSSLNLCSLLELPNDDEASQNFVLPNMTFPSDHLSLVCDFQILI